MQKNKAFTLIELLVVITILMIIMTVTYMPYAHHQKKTLLRQWAREVTQSMTEARNFALHWLDTWSGNLNIWLYFSSGATDIVYYAYPLEENMDINTLKEAYKYKTKKLPQGIQIDSVAWESSPYLFEFHAITWSWSYTSESTIDINISYQWSESPVLQSTIRYRTDAFISDIIGNNG